tara:strand:+ start:59491 stop:61032 length:1542 start_codon:yes stop_codon:yes gene_type:complete
MILKSICTSALLLSLAQAAPQPVSFFPEAPMVNEIPDFKADNYAEVNKKWKASSRKIASDFSESSLSDDFKNKLRKQWLETTTADGVFQLLVQSRKDYAKYSPDVQYFLTQMHTMIPLKGIVWRLRPIFEAGGLFKGNKATHMSAIQFVRTAVTGLSAAFPTSQTDAMIAYFTQPGPEMSEKSQFKTVAEFQNFLVDSYIPYLFESVKNIDALLKNYSEAKGRPQAEMVWDNQMFFGTGSFRDGFNRYVGHGPAEMHIAMALGWEAIHDAYVFSSYNQDDLVNVAGRLGRAFGIDALKSDSNDIGLTDKERAKIIASYTSKGFLSLRKNRDPKAKGDEGYGKRNMKLALPAKRQSVNHFNQAYIKLEGKGSNSSMAINPALYQKDIQNRLNAGVSKMVSAMDGVTEFKDPMSSEVITINVPAFYNEPPQSLAILMANDWEGGESTKSITSTSGEQLKYRNYFSGRAKSWNNNAWAKYVTSASGQKADYMMTAKRIMHYSPGATVLGAVDLFVR